MKRLLSLLVVGLLLSCEAPGVATQELSGGESTLPEELKGLKVYSVSVGEGSYVKVAVLNNTVNSLDYSKGKTRESVIIVENFGYDRREIKIKEIVMENDSMIVARK